MIIQGREMKTTLWQDFSIADKFGAKAVKDTYKRAREDWQDDKVYGTELVLVLNWKCWQHHGLGNTELAKLYEKLYYELDNYVLDNWTGDKLSYFLRETD